MEALLLKFKCKMRKGEANLYGKQQVGKVKNFNLWTYEPDFYSKQRVYI